MTKHKILYLDTSTEEATIAIYDLSLRGGKNDAAILVEEKWAAGRELSKTLTPKYQAILTKAGIGQDEINGLCVFVGPGSFTGLRIGLSFANGLAFALAIPIYETRTQNHIDLSEPQKIALPFYGSEPKITEPKVK